MSNQSDTLAQAHRAVAVVGVGAIMPDALDAFTFWQNIQNGRYSITEVPPDRWNADDYYDPDPSVPDKTYSKIGGWVRDFIFEPYKWRMPIPPKVLEVMDDGQKWAIATCRAALLDYGYRAGEDAGRPLDTERTAVILGNAMAGENHYMTALRIHFPDYVRALRAVPQFDELPPNMQDALLSGMRAGIHNRIPDITEDTMPGELSNIIAGRVANLLDLGGPNFVTDAACASSLAALHAAVEGLIAGHFDAVLTGGIDRNMGPSSFVKFSKIGALSPDGSRPYAEGANGFVMGEGAAVFLLKRLADAERDGDAIYAVIRGIGAASDGKGKGITAPNPIGPRRAIERAWRNAGLSPDTVGYMEGHGTSTRVGDIVEVESMERVLREFDLAHGSIPLGSVKSNLGHLKGAAGAAGLLKAIYALRDKVLPPTVNFERPNPNIDFEHSPFYVHTELRPWDLNGHNRPPDRVRRAGVSSFGFGGTNFHVVLEEHVPGMLTSSRATFAAAGTLRHPTGHRNGLVGAEGTGPADRVPASPGSMRPADAGPGGGLRFAPKAPYRGILVLGASTISGLQARLKVAISDAHAGNAPQPRAPFVTDMTAAERIAIDFGDADELAKRGEKATRALETDIAPVWMPLASQGIYRGRGKPGKVAFLFPGQGSQYVNMLRELYDLDPIVAQTFQEADEVMTPLLGQPLTSYVFVDGPDSGPPDKETLAAAEDKLRDTTITQPAVLTVNVALTRLLASYGITPDIVIGHSLGEYGALVAAGVLPFAQALEVVSARGREMSKVSMEDNGYMAAIFAPIPEVERILASIKGYVVLANINSPSQAVIGGTTPAVDRAIEAFTKADYRAVKIPVSHAFHTEIVAPASEPLKRIIGRMDVHAPRVPLVANVTGDLYPEDRDEIVDLLGRQVASPVQFVKGIETLYREGARILVEVGPKRVLTALAGDILSDREDITTLFTNHPRKGALPSLNEALCGLYAAGVGTAQPKAPIPPERSITKGISLVEPVQTPETHTSFPPATADHTESTTSASARAPERVALRQAQGAAARQTPDAIRPPMPTPPPVVQRHPQSDVEGNDDRYAALGRLFADFMDQGRRIYDGLPPSGGAPEVGARAIPSDGRLPLTGSVVVTGTALGLPGQERRVFDEQNVDRILRGEQFIDLIPYRFRQQMAEKRITRLVKRESGATFELISDPSETIKLAGRAGPFDLAAEFGVPESRIEALDKATQLAMAAGIDALRDAGIPLVLRYRTTSQNTYLPDRWMLPEAMADETGVIFCSAFPGLNRMADEVTRYQQYRALNEQHKTLTQLRMMAEGQDGLLAEIDRRILQIEDELSRLDYGFDRRFIFRVLAMGHSQFAEHIGARGPNTHVNAACATTTHAVSIAEDWMRTGRCRRVIIIAGDDVTSEELMEWIGSGLLATGATTTEERLDRAALPFDQRRHGTIIGMGAAAIVLETEDAVRERGMRGTCEVLSSQTANSAYHGTRLDVEHICEVMERLVGQAEERFGIDRRDIAPHTVFVSHETYTPARGGSASAEIHALRRTFGDRANQVVIANTKGYTGHAMGVGIEDVLAIKSLETGIVPPVANIDSDFQPDPELGDLNLSRGGHYPVLYALRLGAGFGSQIAMTLMRRIPGTGERLVNRQTYDRWLAAMAGYEQAELEVEQRTLRIRDAGPPVLLPARSTWQYGQGPTAWALAPDGAPAIQPHSAGIPRPMAAPVPQPAPAAPVAAKTAAPPTAAPLPGPEGTPERELVGGQDPIIGRVLAIVSEKTGYPPDMLDVELDVEADLGIDTVKQAEIFSAIREAYDIPRRDDLSLRDYNTLTKVIGFVRESRPDLAVASTASAALSPAPAPDVPAPLPTGGQDSVAQRVLAIVSEKTGYPPDMLDLELDVEADLGIDTVKQAEIFSAIREAYDIPRRDDLSLRDYNTLTKVIGFVHEARPDLAAAVSGQTSEAVSQPAEEETVARQSSTDAAPAPSLSAEEPATEPDPVAGLEATYVIPRRVPVPVLRPDLGVCKTTGVSFGPETRVVVVSDSGSAAKYLGYRLRARKTKALILKEATPETAETQIAEWLAEGQIDGVYMLSSLDVEPTLDEMDLDQWRAEQDKRVKTLYTIMRALPNNAFLISATRLGGFHGYTPQGASAPLGGAVTGFTKAYSRERPEALTKALDFDEVDDRQIAELLVNETLSDPGAVEIGYHNGLRFGIGLSEQPVDHLEPTFTIDRDTVFVITGAAGGITAAIVADLARASAGTFYLTDIAPAPDPDNPDLARLGTDDKFLKRDIAKRIMDSGTRPTPVMVERELAALERSACIVNAMNTIARAGGTAHYRMCDVTHAQAVQALIDEAQQAHGHIDIVVHAAGMERSHFLPDKPPREFNLIFDVKADGLFNLLKATQALEHPLQAIVVFSSIAGRFGNAGQTDYSAANDLMCKVISSLRTTRPDTRGVATDWSAWAQIGMATRRSIPEMMRRAGIDMLEPDTAVPIVRREIVFGTRGEVVVAQALGILLESHDPDGGLDIERASERLKHDFPVAGHITGMDTYRGLTFEVELNPQDEPFLHDHAMDGTPLLPGVMGIEGFAEVASLIASDLGHAGERFVVKSIENVDFNAPLKFYRQEPRKATWRAVVTPDASEADVSGLVAHVTLESVREIAATKTQQHAVHFAGQVRLVPQPTAADEALAADPPSWSGETSIEPEAIYRVYFHGPAFQVLDGVQSGGGRVTGKMRADLPPIMGKTKQTLTLPRLIELCMQTAGVWEIGKTGTLALPTAIERVVLHRPQENGALLYAEIKPRTGPGDEVSFDGRVVDDQGNLYLELTGYRTARLPDSVADEEVAPLRAAVEE
jgi:malonyl CoA-acyl carrier protein transacylase